MITIVIYAFVIASTVIVVAWLKDSTKERKKEIKSQKIDDLPVSVSTLVIRSSEGNVPVAHGSTQ